MAQYIDKSALVAEIEKMLQEEYPCDNSEQTTGYHCALYELQYFLNTIKVKEVDLEKYYCDFLQKEWFGKNCNRTISEMMAFTAKHFFELGLHNILSICFHNLLSFLYF